MRHLEDAATRSQPAPTIPTPERRVDVGLWLANHWPNRPIVPDILARRGVGIERYGTPLWASNGRDALVDGYQKVLYLIVYLAQDDIEAERRMPGDLTRQALELAMLIRARLQEYAWQSEP